MVATSNVLCSNELVHHEFKSMDHMLVVTIDMKIYVHWHDI